MFNNTHEYSWLRLGKGDMEKITFAICDTC